MKNRFKYILLLAIPFVVTSCFKDLGNYQYDIENKITISGMDREVTVISPRLLEIDPQVKEPNKFDFLWRAYSVNEAYAKADTLSNEPVFSVPIKLSPGEYYLELELKNKASGYVQTSRTKLFVTTNFAIGWYLLKSEGTTTDLDIFAFDGTTYRNTIKEFNGKSLEGSPRSLTYFSLYRYRNENNGRINGAAYGVTTDKDVSTFSIFDQKIIHDRTSLFFNGPDMSETPIGLQYNAYNNNVYMSDKGFYLLRTSSGGIANRYGLPLKFEDEIVEPMGLQWLEAKYIVYDKKGKQLLRCDQYGVFSRFLKTGPTAAPNADPNKLDVYPLYMSSMGHDKTTFAKTKGHMVMQDFNSSDRYLYVMNHIGYNNYNNPIESVIALDPNLKISKASIFGHNYEFAYLYYPSGNTLYMYDVLAKSESSILPSTDGEITLVKHIWYTPRVVEDVFNYLVVASHKDGKYKVCLYNMLGGKPAGAPVHVFEGDGKIGCVQYMSSKMSPDNMWFYPFH